MKIEIKSIFDARVLFAGEFASLKLCAEAAVKSNADLRCADLSGACLRGISLRYADLREVYMRGSDLRYADMSHAFLSGAELRWADMRYANLRGAYLFGVDLHYAELHGADLTGADLRALKSDPASPEETARLDAVRKIVLKIPERLRMDNWHSNGWPEEEHDCGSAHCIAGWLQALSPEKAIREMDTLEAAKRLAPASSYIFFTSDNVARKWLTDRAYAVT